RPRRHVPRRRAVPLARPRRSRPARLRNRHDPPHGPPPGRARRARGHHPTMTLPPAYTLSPQWAFSPWLVALLVLAAGALVVYLYRAQRQVASRAVVVTLTTLRLLLVALMFALLAGLSVRWTRTASSGGTLWLLVDNSASMAQPDPRATPVEKLRWADAL